MTKLFEQGTDVMSEKEFMPRANLALANMGRAMGGLVPHMQEMGKAIKRMDYLMKAQIAYFNLQWVSRASAEEITNHLKHFHGDILDLERFYFEFGCFPCELLEKYSKESPDMIKWGAALMMALVNGLQPNIDIDLLLMEKSPRFKQAIFFLIMLTIMMLLEAC